MDVERLRRLLLCWSDFCGTTRTTMKDLGKAITQAIEAGESK